MLRVRVSSSAPTTKGPHRHRRGPFLVSSPALGERLLVAPARTSELDGHQHNTQRKRKHHRNSHALPKRVVPGQHRDGQAECKAKHDALPGRNTNAALASTRHVADRIENAGSDALALTQLNH